MLSMKWGAGQTPEESEGDAATEGSEGASVEHEQTV